MTTSQDKLKDQINSKGQSATTRGVHPDGTGDPRGQNPTPQYDSKSSINAGSRGSVKHQLGGYAGIPGVDVTKDYTPSQYPFCQTQESLSGHVIEIDDTRGIERLLIKHSTGSGVEMRSDGTIIISTMRNQITVVNGQQTIRVEGDARMQYDGNLDVTVSGDYTLNVKGNMVTNISGDIGETSKNKTTITGNKKDTANGHRYQMTSKSFTDMTLKERDTVVKGNHDIVSEAETTVASTGNVKISSEKKTALAASQAMQIGSQKVNILGATGTIGGEGVSMYAQNLFATSATFTEGVTAPTFHGDLNGLAASTRSQTYPSTSDAGGASINNTATNTTGTFKPDATAMGGYLNSLYGVNDVKIDAGDVLLNTIDRTQKTQGISDTSQTTSQVRSSMKDEANLNNKDYTANAVAEGTLNPEYVNTVPASTGRMVSSNATPRQARNLVV